jgi:hypothetical protein
MDQPRWRTAVTQAEPFGKGASHFAFPFSWTLIENEDRGKCGNQLPDRDIRVKSFAAD